MKFLPYNDRVLRSSRYRMTHRTYVRLLNPNIVPKNYAELAMTIRMWEINHYDAQSHRYRPLLTGGTRYIFGGEGNIPCDPKNKCA